MTEGHDLGHEARVGAEGLDWQRYVQHFVVDVGGWTALADQLIHRMPPADSAGLDLDTAKKGLQRLAKRGHQDGGQYGRWMLRAFGVPPPAAQWVRRLAQYHRRFADLPTTLRLAQLSMWDREPIASSHSAAWVQVGLASVHHRRADLAACRHHLSRARAKAALAGPGAELESLLLEARLETDVGKRLQANALFDLAEPLLGAADLADDDRICYLVRLTGQRAYHLTKPLPGDDPDFEGALKLFEALPDDSRIPFADYRRASGIAYCRFKLGDVDEGIRLARDALVHAGDGGLVRFRIMALNLLRRMLPAEEAAPLGARAARLASQLEDEDLVQRVRRIRN